MKNNTACLIILVLNLLSCQTEKKSETISSSSHETKIDSLANRYLELGLFSGSILIAKKDSIIYNKNYGYSDYKTNQPFTENTTFKIGKISELFTEAIIKSMSENNMIKLDEKITSYVPEIAANYTIRDLLNHESYLPNIQSIKKANSELKYSTIDYANIAEIGNTTSKSDLDYNILGVAIQRIHNTSFQKVIDKYVSDWGLENTYFKKKDTINEAKGHTYFYKGEELILTESPNYNIDEAFSSRGFKSTITDIFKLTQKTQKEHINVHGYLDIGGFSYALKKDKKTNYTLIILSNRKQPVASEMTHSILAILENNPYEIPLLRIQVEINTALYKEYSGLYALSPDRNLEVLTANDSLFFMMGPNKIHLKPQSENQFFMNNTDGAIRFGRDSTGTVSKVTLFNGFLNGDDIKKIKQQSK